MSAFNFGGGGFGQSNTTTNSNANTTNKPSGFSFGGNAGAFSAFGGNTNPVSFGAFGGANDKGKTPVLSNSASTGQPTTTTAAPTTGSSNTAFGQSSGTFGSQPTTLTGSTSSAPGTTFSAAPTSSSGFTGTSAFGTSAFPSSSSTAAGSGTGLSFGANTGGSNSGAPALSFPASSASGQGSLFPLTASNNANTAAATSSSTATSSTPSFSLGAPTGGFGAPATTTSSTATSSTPAFTLGAPTGGFGASATTTSSTATSSTPAFTLGAPTGGFGAPATSTAGSAPSFSLGTSSTASTTTFPTLSNTPATTTAASTTSATGSTLGLSLNASAPTTSAPASTLGVSSTAPTTSTSTSNTFTAQPLGTTSATPALTTQPGSCLASKSTATTRETIPASTINAIITRLNSENLESILNKWTQDLNTATREFHRQAVDVAHWDKALLDNGQLISQLYSETLEAEYSQKLIDQNLEYIELQQTGLAKTLDEYEQFINQAYNSVQSQNAHVKATDDEREKMYSLAESVGQRLDHVNEQLTSVVKEINELAGLDSSSSNGVSGSAGSSAPTDPFSQVVQILNAHLTTLKWLDHNCDTLQTQIQTLETRAASSQLEAPSARSMSDVVAPPQVQRNLGSVTQPLSPHPPRASLSYTTTAATGIVPAGAQTPLSAYAQRYGSNPANQPQSTAAQATPTAGGNLTASPFNAGTSFRSEVASRTGMPQNSLFGSNQNTLQLPTASPSPATSSLWRR
ncbi:FG-nucleoporin nsp1 [Dispira parvispora]|uniref:FG-nucleoporin nsp1 n=1 Tax=Dispira parvispora TaxID=1520584 RepID=A0A9W8ATH2_9FUNG|nr:FG-nucleoporin nsp1 [Dispira parvispora]